VCFERKSEILRVGQTEVRKRKIEKKNLIIEQTFLD
jgi:hypothetical protein